MPLPGTFLPHAATSAAAARPAGAPKFFMPSMPAAQGTAQSAWGQPSIPEAGPEATYSGGVDSSQADEAGYNSGVPSIPTLAASEADDAYTSYAALQTQWPQAPSNEQHPAYHHFQHGFAGGQAGYGQTQGQAQGFPQDGELTEVQL